jgi:hypothetical protein
MTSNVNRDDDSAMSGLYTTYTDPEWQGSANGANVTSGAARAGAANQRVAANANSNNKRDNNIFRSSSAIQHMSADSIQVIHTPASDDDSMSGISGIYTTDGVSVTQGSGHLGGGQGLPEQQQERLVTQGAEERFRASVRAEERKILKEYSLESGSASFESYPDGLFLPKELTTIKTPSPKKSKQKWSPFVSSVGTNDFDLESLESDGIMRDSECFQVLGIKDRDASSPRGTEKTGSPSTYGGNAILSSSYDDVFPDVTGGYAGRSTRAARDLSAREKKKAAAAAAGMSRRPSRCRLERVICALVFVMVIALGVAVGALIAAKHTGGDDNNDGANSNASQQNSNSNNQVPTPSIPVRPTVPTQPPVGAEPPLMTGGAFTAAPVQQQGSFSPPTAAPVTVTVTSLPTVPPTFFPTMVPTSAPIVVVIEATASPTGLRATRGPSAMPVMTVVETQSPSGVPVVATQSPSLLPVPVVATQSPSLLPVPVPVPATQSPSGVSLTVPFTERPISGNPTLSPRPSTPNPTLVPTGPVTLSPTVSFRPTLGPTPSCAIPDAFNIPFFVSIRVGLRTCAWLAIAPDFQNTLCLEGLEAYDLCRTTCNNCGPTPAPTFARTSAPTVSFKPTLPPSPLPVDATRSPTGQPTVLVVTSGPTTLPAPQATLRDFLITRSPRSAQALDDSTTSQSRALVWMENDPNIGSLSLTEELFLQRWVMATLGFGANSASWNRSNSWLGNGVDVCQWFGVGCDNAGNVVSLNLRDNRMSGSLPAELSLLGGSLVTMDMGANQLTGAFPSDFGILANLQTLRLDNNGLSGNVPEEIGNMRSLVVLDFQRNSFSGPVPQSIIFLQNLNQLIFNTNDMTGQVPPGVCAFANLQALVLDCREIDCDCWTQCYYQCGGDSGIVCQNN